MYTNDRDAYRQAFFIAWQKYQKKLPLEPVEQQLVNVIIDHPEYQLFLHNEKQLAQQEFAVEENPFLHMSLHISLREQIQLDRPAGIREISARLAAQSENSHHVEHQMMMILFTMMRQSQAQGVAVSDDIYLQALKQLIDGK